MESLETIKQGLRDNLKSDDIKQTLDSLEKRLKKGTSKYGGYILLSGRYNRILRDQRAGILSGAEFNSSRNGIRRDLLEFIEDLDGQDIEKKDETESQPSFGELFYRIPTQMVVGEEINCLVRIAPTREILLWQLTGSDEDKIREKVLLAEKMQVELMCQSENQPFSIRNITNLAQFIHPQHHTEWVFAVKPILTGRFKLLLRISAIRIVNNAELSQDTVLEESVLVSSTGTIEEPDFIKSPISVVYSYASSAAVNRQEPVPINELPIPGLRRLPVNYWYRTLATVAGIIVFAISGFAAFKRYRDYSDWQNARKGHSEKSYKIYIQEHPNGHYFEEAKDSLETLRNPADSSTIISPPPKSDYLDLLNDSSYWVALPGGTFEMGSEQFRDDECSHTESVMAFNMARLEVTQAQWREIMGDNPSFNNGCDSCPVENVSWNRVQEFLKRISDQTGRHFRLPYEKEWEYAAFLGKKGVNYAGKDFAWSDINASGKPHPVAMKKPNALNIFDLTGNVAEWCEDYYSPYRNCNSLKSHRSKIARGGSYNQTAKEVCRISYRHAYNPSTGNKNVGFRIVTNR